MKKGYLKEAVINYIALLGWAPKGENEIFSLEELVKEFDIHGLSKSPAIFDLAKLKALISSSLFIERTLTLTRSQSSCRQEQSFSQRYLKW